MPRSSLPTTLPCLLSLLTLAACGVDERQTSQTSQALQARLRTQVLELVLDNGDRAATYYPPAGGDEAPHERRPVLVHLQGGSVDAQHYAGYGHGLARAGFVAIIPNHLRVLGPPGSAPSPLTEGQVVAAAVRAVTQATRDPQSPLYGLADVERIVLTGHSFGGVVGLYTVAGLCMPPFCSPPLARPAIRAAAFFGSHLVRDGKVDPIATQGVPVALLSGLEDGRALPSQVRMTSAALRGRASLVPIAGVNHYGITDDNPPPGATLDPRPQSLDQGQSVRLIARTVAEWLQSALRSGGPRPW